MITTELDNCAIRGLEFLPATSTERQRSIQARVVELAHSLERLDNSPSVTADGESMDRSDDEKFIYLEADLPGISELEIDINIHDGRVYVRLAR